MRKRLLTILLLVFHSLCLFSQQSLWVGQSYTFDVTSSVLGSTANLSWSTSGGYLSLSGSGFYRTITVTKYFEGTATVTCEWDYRLTSSDKYTHKKRTVSITCRDNKVSISPTHMTLSTGEKGYVSYSHQFDNQYTSAANAYFQSTDISVCTVSTTGEVIAKNPGTAYINVYSQISSVAPYCKVIVEKTPPTSIEIQSDLTLTGGESITLEPTLIPSNAKSELSWTSSNPSVAKIDNSGLITALQEGNSIITVTTDNGLSASCNVKVNKGKLIIYSDINSGWVDKGTNISLRASQPSSVIYYTIDESIPNPTSNVYSSPLTVNDNLIIKAYASTNGFYDSDVITLKYNVRDFTTQSIYPENNQTVHRFIIPHITFNQPFDKGENFDKIVLTDNSDNIIPFTLYIGKNQLFISPHQIFDDLKNYHIIIPENAIYSKKGEGNKELAYNFNTGIKITKISYGDENCAIVKSDGSLWVWGRSRFGQLGTADKSQEDIVKKPVKIMDNVKDVNMSFQRGIALKNDKTVLSWGRNDSGYLGTGDYENHYTPVQILDNISKIYCGDNTSAAIAPDGTMYMWGSNFYGQIGDGLRSTAISPKKILSNVSDIAVYEHTAAAIVDGSDIYCWGRNCHKEIFNYPIYGSSEKVTRPTKLTGYCGTNVATTAHNVIFLDNGTVNLCGYNYHGIFGNGLHDEYITMGMQKPISNIKEIKASRCHILALDKENSLWGWGENKYGQIGNGQYSDVYKPYKILDDVEFFCVGPDNSAAILSNGDVYAWGDNSSHQLLGAIIDSKTSIPTKIFDGPTSSDIRVQSVDLFLANDYIAPQANTLAIPIINPANVSIRNITWSSSNEEIVSVDNNGVVTGITDGIADITAIIECANGNTHTVSTEITVDINSSITDFNINNLATVLSKNKNIIVRLPHTTSLISLYDVAGKLIALKQDCNYAEFPDIKDGIYIVRYSNQAYKIIVK